MHAFRFQRFDDRAKVCRLAERLVMRKCKTNYAYSKRTKEKEPAKRRQY